MIVDPVFDYLDKISDALGSIPWRTPAEIPAEVRERIAGLYVQELGREPNDADLAALLEFVRGGNG